MKSVFIFPLILLSLIAKSQAPLTINDIMDIKTLTYKKDFESVTKILAHNNFEFSKKEENYDHGSYYVIADLECQRDLPPIQSTMGEGFYIYTQEIVNISYTESTDFTQLYIWHSYRSDLSYFKNSFDYLKELNWSRAEFGSNNKIDRKYGHTGGYDHSYTIPDINKDSLILNSSDKLFRLVEMDKNIWFSREYECGLSEPVTKKFGYILTNDSCYNYHLSINELNPKFVSSENLGLSHILKIPILKHGDIFLVSIIIGGEEKKYIFDSGASDVTLNQSTYDKLVGNGIIQFKHRLPKGSYRLADGAIKEYQRTLIPSIIVGGNRVSNIAASIVPDGQPLLLGKSFLDKFKSWKIDNSKNILIIQLD